MRSHTGSAMKRKSRCRPWAYKQLSGRLRKNSGSRRVREGHEFQRLRKNSRMLASPWKSGPSGPRKSGICAGFSPGGRLSSSDRVFPQPLPLMPSSSQNQRRLPAVGGMPRRENTFPQPASEAPCLARRDRGCLLFCSRRLCLDSQPFVKSSPSRGILDRGCGEVQRAFSDSSFARVTFEIQFTSQVLPPSSENDCSKWAEFGVMSDQTYRVRIVLPFNVSWQKNSPRPFLNRRRWVDRR